jgi:opacity protein-like surface antigen
MKRCLSIACLLMLVASSVAGAATKGSNEMLFGFSGLNNLSLNTFFSDNGFGLRHYLSDNLAIRPCVVLGLASHTDDGQAGNTDHKYTSNYYGLSLAMEKHMGDSKSLSPFLGAGVEFTAGKTKDEPSHGIPAGTDDVLSVTNTSTHFGVFGLVGLQWAFAGNLSLDAEYQLGLAASSSKREEVVQGWLTDTQKHSGFGLGLSTATLSLSVAL